MQSASRFVSQGVERSYPGRLTHISAPLYWNAAGPHYALPQALVGGQPASEQEEFSGNEKHPKNRLVVSSQPKRQVNVEVVLPFLGVATCQVGQWAAAPVRGEDHALDRSEEHTSELQSL